VFNVCADAYSAAYWNWYTVDGHRKCLNVVILKLVHIYDVSRMAWWCNNRALCLSLAVATYFHLFSDD